MVFPKDPSWVQGFILSTSMTSLMLLHLETRSCMQMIQTLYCVGKNFDQVCSQLNNILEQLLLWSTTNKLCIHPVKSEVMILSKSGFIGPAPPICFGNNFINVVNKTTCLGLIIDNRITWALHVDHVKKIFCTESGRIKKNEEASCESAGGNLL